MLTKQKAIGLCEQGRVSSSKPPASDANYSRRHDGLGSKLGSNLSALGRPISGLNGAESTISVKVNSRMLYH